MAVSPLVFEIIITFIIASSVLHRYGNWYHHHIVVTLSVLIAWYFSMLIVFILPLDVSNTIYETCLNAHSLVEPRSDPLSTFESTNDSLSTVTNVTTIAPTPLNSPCQKPYSYVPSGVFPVFWRVVYWTSQVLTWVILPLMQSYTKAGDFTFGSKLRSAIIDNAIYYGSYLLIVGILLLYIALRPDIYLDGSKLRTIAATASNTWGLFWLVLLLGYGLVEVPRSIWHSASAHHTINHAYFRAAKLLHEKAEAEDHLNDLLQEWRALQAPKIKSMRALGERMSPTHPLRPCMDIIESKVPTELLDQMRGMQPPDSPHADVPSEKALVRLHKQLLKALQHHRRVDTQWGLLMEKILALEDKHKSSVSVERIYYHTYAPKRPNFINTFYTPRVEWYWECRAKCFLLRALAVFCALVSVAVVWSELTFFVKEPPLTLFANFVQLAQKSSDYFTIELISTLTMAYIALCAYSTLFKVRVLNLYYLAPHHLTDEYSLIFSGMMLCRLTPPMCLNFLSLIHMDSHILEKPTEETHYTQIMGHMDVIPIISDGFNVYFPMMIVALCLATYYNLGSRLLSALGFQQFIGDDELTTDLIEEGRTIASRESRKRQRMEESAQRRREFTQRFGVGESTLSMYRSARERAENLVRPGPRRENSVESAQLELLGDTQPSQRPDYSSRTSTFSHYHIQDSTKNSRSRGSSGGGRPDHGLFDDV